MSLKIEIPNESVITITHLILDFSGTLATDGILLSGVAERLAKIAEQLKIIVLTADTYGTAKQSLKGMPCEVHVIQTGYEKAEFIKRIGTQNVIAIGNGQNDVDMVRLAAVGIVVVGFEGASGELILEARMIVCDICVALDLVLNPIRLVATLRK